MSTELVKNTRKRLYCSFCGKEQGEVGYLIAGPTVFICNECVELCHDIGHRISTEPDKTHDPLASTSFADFRAKHRPR